MPATAATQPYELDITGAATAIAAGELAPTELTLSVLARVAASCRCPGPWTTSGR